MLLEELISNMAASSLFRLQRVCDGRGYRDGPRLRGHLRRGQPHGDLDQPRPQPRRPADHGHRARLEHGRCVRVDWFWRQHAEVGPRRLESRL